MSEDNNTENTQEPDFLNLSDDEFERFGLYPPESPASEDVEESSDNTEQEDTLNEEEQSDESEVESNQGEAEGLDVNEGEETDQEELDTETSDNEEEDSTDDEPESIKASAFYKALTAPIKANGKMVSVTSPEEAIKLIQKGLGYNAEMVKLKPAKQMLKTLEQNKMLNNESITLAVDLLSGNTDALIKLMKDKGIDPLELDVSTEKEYKAVSRIASEESVQFDDVINSIKDSSYFDSTVEQVQKWDKKSQTSIAQDPRLIAQLNAQMENGIYKQIKSELDRQQALDSETISGLSDLEAYVAVGRLMTQNGSLVVPNAQGTASTSQVGKQVQPRADSRTNLKTQSKKKGAGLPRSKPAQKDSSNEINALAMSDEEFDKLLAKFT